jgi:hypothetical protein
MEPRTRNIRIALFVGVLFMMASSNRVTSQPAAGEPAYRNVKLAVE